MNRSRQSPITLKKQDPPTYRRRSELCIDEQLDSIQQKLRCISFNEREEEDIQQLWNLHSLLKQEDYLIKNMQEKLEEIGHGLSNNFSKKSPKINKNLTNHSRTNSFTVNLNRDIDSLQQQIKELKERKIDFQSIEKNELMRQMLEGRQSLSERISLFEKELIQGINGTKMYGFDGKVCSGGSLYKKILESPKLETFKNKGQKYKRVIGMLSCLKKNMQNSQLKERVKEKYEKILSFPGHKTKKNMQDILIDCEKKQSIENVFAKAGRNNQQIMRQANYLKDQIGKIQLLWASDQKLAQTRFQLAHDSLESLKARAEGSIQEYYDELNKIQQALTFSKERLYSIQHKDVDLVHSNRKLGEIKERWDDLLRMLNFDYGNLS